MVPEFCDIFEVPGNTFKCFSDSNRKSVFFVMTENSVKFSKRKVDGSVSERTMVFQGCSWQEQRCARAWNSLLNKM